MAGISGAAFERSAEVTPSPFSLPLFTCGSIDGMLANIMVTVPAITSL